MATKLRVKAIIAAFTTKEQAYDFINNNLSLTSDTFVSSDIREIDGVFKATIVFCNPYDATRYVLENKSLEQIKAIAKAHKVKLTGEQIVKTTLSRKEVEQKLESGEIKDSFIRHNLDALFGEDSVKYRKQVFAGRGIKITTQKVKKTVLCKSRLISRLLMEASTFNYDDYAYEVSFIVNR